MQHTQIKGDVEQRAYNKHTNPSSCWGTAALHVPSHAALLKGERFGKITRARLTSLEIDESSCALLLRTDHIKMHKEVNWPEKEILTILTLLCQNRKLD